MKEIETSDKSQSKLRYAEFIGKTVGLGGAACEGSYEVDGVILRFRGGLLDGGAEAAVEFPSGHKEWWRGGLPHREELPAVVSLGGSWEEWWESGELLRVVFFGEEAAMEEAEATGGGDESET